jgi:hypothetical protein
VLSHRVFAFELLGADILIGEDTRYFSVKLSCWWVEIFVSVPYVSRVFPLPSMNRLNQTEPATFYNFAVLGFLEGFCFLLFVNFGSSSSVVKLFNISGMPQLMGF